MPIYSVNEVCVEEVRVIVRDSIETNVHFLFFSGLKLFRGGEENGGFVHHVARVVRSKRDPDAGHDLRQTTLPA